MTKIKICGLTRWEDVEAANRLRPDYIGFVFAKSPRQVTMEQAEVLGKNLDPGIRRIGVFVNEGTERILELGKRGIIDGIQLHGEEGAEEILRLKEALGLPVIKAVRVRSPEQVLLAEKLPCDFLLLDTYQKGIAGGSGKDFPLSLIPELRKPYFLAGGLTPENVREKLRFCRPYAVDVSSGVEREGRKQEPLMERFVEEVRNEQRKI